MRRKGLGPGCIEGGWFAAVDEHRQNARMLPIQRLFDGFGIGIDDAQEDSGGGIGNAAAEFPVAHSAEWQVKAGGELFLGEVKA